VPAQRRYAYTFGALERRVPTLVIWGEHDPFFRPPGAEAFRRDNPEARVELLDTGHFALETLADHIMHRIREMYAPANDS
jgi:pimeloyl-ACP methyl ester carboxylesterase